MSSRRCTMERTKERSSDEGVEPLWMSWIMRKIRSAGVPAAAAVWKEGEHPAVYGRACGSHSVRWSAGDPAGAVSHTEDPHTCLTESQNTASLTTTLSFKQMYLLIMSLPSFTFSLSPAFFILSPKALTCPYCRLWLVVVESILQLHLQHFLLLHHAIALVEHLVQPQPFDVDLVLHDMSMTDAHN